MPGDPGPGFWDNKTLSGAAPVLRKLLVPPPSIPPFIYFLLKHLLNTYHVPGTAPDA